MRKVLIRETFLTGILQGLSKCFICLEEGSSMPSSACCGQPRHKKCEKRFRRTLASYTNACAQCRHPFEDPCDPLTEARIHEKMALCQTRVSKDIPNDL